MSARKSYLAACTANRLLEVSMTRGEEADSPNQKSYGGVLI